jgi:hypothetical protein
MVANVQSQPLFALGQVVAMPGALAAIERSGELVVAFIRRHAMGDWGDICDEDKKLNNQAVVAGARLLSSYLSTRNEKLWIITEADRAVTTLLLPDEY